MAGAPPAASSKTCTRAPASLSATQLHARNLAKTPAFSTVLQDVHEKCLEILHVTLSATWRSAGTIMGTVFVLLGVVQKCWRKVPARGRVIPAPRRSADLKTECAEAAPWGALRVCWGMGYAIVSAIRMSVGMIIWIVGAPLGADPVTILWKAGPGTPLDREIAWWLLAFITMDLDLQTHLWLASIF